MKLDFTIINKLDGLSVYAEKILEYIHFSFNNELFLLHKNYRGKIKKEDLKHEIITDMIAHRLKPGVFDKEFYYSPTHHGPIFNKNKILTVHDITPLLLKNKSFKQYLYYRLFLKLSVNNTKKIITVSQYTKDKIVSYYGMNDRKDDIIVIHNATDIEVVPAQAVDDIPLNYLFMPGVHSDYKNYKRVIEAIKDFKDIKLLITSGSREVINYCKKFSYVKTLSNLSYGQIKYLYMNSRGLIYPSIIEGFGFPALEAARLNVPIVTSKNSSMQEFLGDSAAIYVDPLNLEEIKQGAEKILESNNHLITVAAYNNTKHLVWKQNANQVIKILNENRE